MKRLVVYYSLSGNTEEAAEKIAKAIGADLLKVETVKEMPKGFLSQMLVGGGQVMMKYIPELKPMDKDANDYDEIILGSPIWNSKGVPAINAFLKDEKAAAKVNVGSAKVMEKLGMKYDHSSSYTKNDGSVTFESDVYTLTIKDINEL